MSHRRILASALVAIACLPSGCAPARDAVRQEGVLRGAPLRYPAARTGDQVDSYHGTLVRDPYRWLEESSDETRDWIDAENTLTTAFLDGIPARDRVRERLTELWNYERRGLPRSRDGQYFFLHNDGLQNQSVLYVTKDLARPGRVVIDPNSWTSDGTVALASYVPSPDGSLVAYAISDGGSDWRRWRVRDVASGADLDDVITRNKFGGLTWNKDGTGLFYTSYVRPGKDAELSERNPPPEIAFHRLGELEEADRIILARTATGISQGFSLSEDETALFVSRWSAESRHTELDYLPLGAAAGDPIPLIAGYDARYHYVGDDGHVVWIRTDLDAPRWRVIALPLDAAGDPSARVRWREVIPQADDAMESVRAVGGHLIVTYLEDAASRVKIFETDGALVRELELPGIGTVGGFGGEWDRTETFFTFSSFIEPATIYRHDVATGTTERVWNSSLPFDPADYETNQVFYTSTDGTRIPMFLTLKKGVERDGTNPTYLYGYGGFNNAISPFFRVDHFAWVEMGGILAVANIRGGSEYGEEWHEAGTKEQKQNVFDDFIAAAEWLVDEQWTSRARLAIGGRSNGGLLVGACLIQRPELFGVALPAVGVMDMLRYHLFTIGWAWAGDYGTVDDPSQFAALRAYSPVHNVKPGTRYPPTLLTTADHDDRVVPAHTYKFTAALQAAQAGPAPILVRIDTRAGHGAGKATTMKIEEAADIWAFVMRAMELE